MTMSGDLIGGTVLTEAAIAAWEDPPRAPDPGAAPVLSIEGFAGPLDWLLELVRAQKIDLARLSIRALIEAFASAMAAALAGHGEGVAGTEVRPWQIRPRRIEHWAVWTVMAASLTELWSRLLLPREAQVAQDAVDAAEALRRHLLERARMQAAAGWLERQPQLGRDSFGRGRAEDLSAGRSSDLTDLLRACLTALQVPQDQVAQSETPRPRLWQSSDAIRLLRAQLATLPDYSPLDRFLPPLVPGPQAASTSTATRLRADARATRASNLTMFHPPTS